MKSINFAPYLSESIQNAGYVRKVLAVEEYEDNESGHRYGTISESNYYPKVERESIPCEAGDCFVISTIKQEPSFGLYLFIYYLVQVDSEAENNLRLLNCTSRIGGYDATEFPRPEHIFVETLLTLGLFQPTQMSNEHQEEIL